MVLKMFIASLVAFFALVNPVHKILVINSLQGQFTDKELRFLSIKSSITAFIILLFFQVLGELIFDYVFHIDLYAFQITCGMVLVYTGLNGLQKGEFLKIDKNIKLVDVANVPVAIPMIAGPATITAAVTFPANYGSFITGLSMFVALGINLVLMLYAKKIGATLVKYNFMSALIRITGLIVATIGVQLMLDGIRNFMQTC
jgi:multiple antibiotic resistance protein